MCSDRYKECIVTFIDLVGIKDLAKSGLGSKLMIQMHQQVKARAGAGHLSSHPYIYLWNDSILLLAYLNEHEPRAAQKNRILREADNLRRQVDRESLRGSFGISVQGMAFPGDPTSEPVFTGKQGADKCDIVVIKASSWAFANCLQIDNSLRTHQASWYIDSRISKMLHTDEPVNRTASVQMLPDGKKRPIAMYKTYLWGGQRAN